jgi:hypothetical protein
MCDRKITVHIVNEYNVVFNKTNKKHKYDYILNVGKIIKSKIDTCSVVLNQIQIWVLNYEIAKLLKKVITASTDKYTDIYYINKNLSSSAVLNLSEFLYVNYKNVKFDYIIHIKEKDSDMIDIYTSILSNGLKIKKAIV